MYEKHECRCGVCRGAKAAAARAYRARRKAEGRPIERSGPESECAHCAAPFRARTDQPGLYCSTDCVKLAQGWDPGQSRRRFRPTSTLRATIYERDGWTCQICQEPVNRGARLGSRGYPTLDHITPQAHGGSDEPSNLRLAHMGCNADRGAPSPERGPRVPVRVLRVR